MKTQALRGKIEPLALVEVLAYLGRNKETGILNCQYEDVKKSIIVHQGKVIFARSNRVEDRLGDMLLAEGEISKDQYQKATDLLYEKGYRHGRALVEIGAITPKILWNAIQRQIRTICCSVVPWSSGNFEFIQQGIKHREAITLQLSALELVVDLVRHMDNREIFKTRFTDLDDLYQKVDEFEQPFPEFHLEAYEQYVLNFCDGTTTIRAICEKSDIGGDESLRVLYLLRCLGVILHVGKAPEVTGDIHPLVVKYNDVFRYVNQYLGERVGNVGTSLLKKYFDDIAKSHHDVLQGVTVTNEGSLDAVTIQRNLEAMSERMDLDETAIDMALEEAMEEYLYSGILAVKKMLGSDHESYVLSHIEGLN